MDLPPALKTGRRVVEFCPLEVNLGLSFAAISLRHDLEQDGCPGLFGWTLIG